jgi:hypothetical protein
MALLLLSAACSKRSEIPASLALTGACSVEIESKTVGAEITVDGIEIGTGAQAMTQIPCGEKQVRVRKHGYEPYEAYLSVSKNEPLKVSVTLKKAEPVLDFALSQDLINQIREGRRIRNPTIPGAPGEPSSAELENASSPDPVSSETTRAEAAPSGEAPAEWDSVEAWR